MIEVFKTDVNTAAHAQILIDEINQKFAHYKANFDLSDCDRILRIKSNNGIVDAPAVIELLQRFGYNAAILPDEEVQSVPSAAFRFFSLLNTMQS